MRVALPGGGTTWLTYCMNVHPGGTLRPRGRRFARRSCRSASDSV